MPKYQLIGRLTLANATTNPIRINIEASSKREAKQKFEAYLQRKAEPVVDSCELATVDTPAPDPFEESRQFFDTLASQLGKK